MNTLPPSVPGLTRKFADLWQSLPAEIPDGVSIFTEAEQCERQERIEELVRKVESSPNPEAARNTINQFIAGADELASLREHSDHFSESSRRFVERAHEFDRRIREKEIRQAIRNVWVFHALQLMFTGRVEFQQGAFAYSLLYPYTDNFFDNPRIAPGVKRDFGAWVSRRLSGDVSDVGAGVAGKVHGLIGLIEEEYPRNRYPVVYEGLHAIHDAQVSSLGGPARDRLQRSVRKGGTSVLADALLVRGRLDPNEFEYSFRLGVLLQFIDDLQDGTEDGRQSAVTLFSAGMPRAAMHESTLRLLQFLIGTFGSGAPAASGKASRLNDLMQRSCLALTCGAVYRQADRFDRNFVERIAPLCPVHPRYLVSLRERAPALRRRFPGGIQSLLLATC